MDVPPDSTAQAVKSASKTKPRLYFAAMNNLMMELFRGYPGEADRIEENVMNIILLEKIAKLGDIGEAVKVKSGYARNYLFPQGKAVPATKRNLEDFEQRRAELLAAHDEKIALARSRAAKLADLAVAIDVNASDEGRLFGSVTARDVAAAVNAKADSDLAKSEVILPGGSIRQCGEFEVIADLGCEVTATFALSVVNRNAPTQAKDDEDEAEDQAGDQAEDQAAIEVVVDLTGEPAQE